MGNFKRSKGYDEKRARARNLLKLWYDDRLDNQTNRYACVAGKPTLPARKYNPKSPGPEPVAKYRQRQMEDPDGKPMFDKNGDPVMETVPIMDTLTAHFQGRQHDHGHDEYVKTINDASGYVGIRENRIQHYQWGLVKRSKTIMNQVFNIEPKCHAALEMKVAGYGDKDIAQEFGCGEIMARKLYDEGLALMVVLIMDRSWRLQEHEQMDSAGADTHVSEEAPGVACDGGDDS